MFGCGVMITGVAVLVRSSGCFVSRVSVLVLQMIVVYWVASASCRSSVFVLLGWSFGLMIIMFVWASTLVLLVIISFGNCFFSWVVILLTIDIRLVLDWSVVMLVRSVVLDWLRLSFTIMMWLKLFLW